MEPSEKELKRREIEQRQAQSLKSGNTKVILEALSDIRKRGSVTILPEVFELMIATLDIEVFRAAENLLNDLNRKEVIPVIIDALHNESYEPIQRELLASCWQSGLDYHQHIDTFIDLALTADYASALECVTVIEECLADISTEKRSALVAKIDKEIKKVSKEKIALIRELVQLIKRY